MTTILFSLAHAGDPTAAVQAFIDAGDARDTRSLERVLHDDFRVLARMPDGLKVMERSLYLDLIKAKKLGGVPRETNVHTVMLQGDLATVRGTLASAKADFDCTWTLARNGESWQVIQDAVVFRPKS